MKAINAKKYAEIIGVQPAAITMKLKVMDSPALPGAVEVTKLGYTWLIILKNGYSPKLMLSEFKALSWPPKK